MLSLCTWWNLPRMELLKDARYALISLRFYFVQTNEVTQVLNLSDKTKPTSPVQFTENTQTQIPGLHFEQNQSQKKISVKR